MSASLEQRLSASGSPARFSVPPSGPGPHGTPVLDDFNRADEDPVAGGLWVSDYGDFHIVSGELVEAGGNSTISWVNDFALPVEWFWTIGAVGTATDPQLYPQIVFDPNNRYELDYFGRSAWQTYEKVNGVWSNPLSGVSLPVADLSPGDQIGMSYDGANLQTWYRPIGGEWQMKTDDATVAHTGKTATRLLMDSYGGWSWDEFGGGGF